VAPRFWPDGLALIGANTKSTLYLKQQKDYVNPIDNLVGKND